MTSVFRIHVTSLWNRSIVGWLRSPGLGENFPSPVAAAFIVTSALVGAHKWWIVSRQVVQRHLFNTHALLTYWSPAAVRRVAWSEGEPFSLFFVVSFARVITDYYLYSEVDTPYSSTYVPIRLYSGSCGWIRLDPSKEINLSWTGSDWSTNQMP